MPTRAPAAAATASTGFANAAAAIARSLTDAFESIHPLDLPGFIAAQVAGARCGLPLTGWLLAGRREPPATAYEAEATP